MKKTFFFSLVLMLLSVDFWGQRHTVQYVVPPSFQYSRISTFSEHLAKVEVGANRVGFMDREGKIKFILDDAYANVGDFHSDRALVQKGEGTNAKYGYIDKRGQVVLPFRYLSAQDFSEGRAGVYSAENGWEIIDRQGKVIFGDSLIITEMPHTRGGGYYEVEPFSFHNGLMLSGREARYGYIDRAGKRSIPFQYDLASDFSDQRAIVARWLSDKPSGGKDPLDRIYAALPEGEKEGVWSIIDRKGETIYTFKDGERPDWQHGFSCGLIGFFKDRKKGFINTEGKIIVPAQYPDSPYPFPYSDGVSIVQVRGQEKDNSDGYMKIVDTTGEMISKIPFKTTYGLIIDSKMAFHEGLLSVKIQTEPNTTFGLWGYLDKQGEVIITPQFTTALDFHQGRAIVVTQDGRLGVLRNPLEKEH